MNLEMCHGTEGVNRVLKGVFPCGEAESLSERHYNRGSTNTLHESPGNGRGGALQRLGTLDLVVEITRRVNKTFLFLSSLFCPTLQCKN